MSPATNPDAVREAVGVFDNVETLHAAIDELESPGFDRANSAAKNVRNEALLLLSIFFLLFRGPRAACSNAGHARRRLIELDRPDRMIDH